MHAYMLAYMLAYMHAYMHASMYAGPARMRQHAYLARECIIKMRLHARARIARMARILHTDVHACAAVTLRLHACACLCMGVPVYCRYVIMRVRTCACILRMRVHVLSTVHVYSGCVRVPLCICVIAYAFAYRYMHAHVYRACAFHMRMHRRHAHAWTGACQGVRGMHACTDRCATPLTPTTHAGRQAGMHDA